MLFAFGEPTPLFYGLIGLILLFVIQLFLCLKAKRTWVKFIPAAIILLAVILCLPIYIGVFGKYSAGAVSGNSIVAFVFLFVSGCAAVGILPAWIIYLVLKLKNDKT